MVYKMSRSRDKNRKSRKTQINKLQRRWNEAVLNKDGSYEVDVYPDKMIIHKNTLHQMLNKDGSLEIQTAVFDSSGNGSGRSLSQMGLLPQLGIKNLNVHAATNDLLGVRISFDARYLMSVLGEFHKGEKEWKEVNNKEKFNEN